ncbi:hypothetical protein [Burkholderia anthina]|uniref:hypothetical protein n=1 Tax=Burkholderia anthina TaxID=179879 RepID=UPI001AA04E01|nr:hypothetical protein [Burkholderia anthina]QTD88901.1 hypothetical protein J4G50_13900 [Burkholderia anthina]
MSLVTLIRTELLARKGDWPRISQETDISYWWLTKFAQGRIENPGVRVLEKLQQYFATAAR